jgi:pyruvate kinase
VSDIANAILDGTDAIMLSEETTLGDYPVEAVKVMAKVARRIEGDPLYHAQVLEMQKMKHVTIGSGVADAITNEAVDIANTVGAKVIIALTHSGFTARMIARYKPLQPLLGFTPNETTYHQLLFTFGCTPVLIKKFKTLNEVLRVVKTHCVKEGLTEKGDKVVIAVGMPFSKKIDSNMLLVQTI